MESILELTYNNSLSRAELAVKRMFDIVGAMLCLVLFSPLILIVAIVLKFYERGPVLYRQERIGLNGKPFNILKFRTMVQNAEPELPLLFNEDDDRVTNVGGWLRKHHLDELPQLWNVLVGDMSFVGPRPERKFFIDKIMAVDSDYRLLYALRPGITSEATLYNGYTDTIEKMIVRLHMDLDYLEHRSFVLDLKILAKTFLSIIFDRKF